MKKYIQLQATYKTPKGAIWEHSSGKIYFNAQTHLLEDERTFIQHPEWFAVLENTYAKSWKDLSVINGHYINNDCHIDTVVVGNTEAFYKDVYATENQAKAALAEAQLSQLLKEIYDGEGWKPVFNGEDNIFCITFFERTSKIITYNCSNQFLAFPTRELAEQFLENHRELIEVYFSKYTW